jgi:hypothetical protein
VEGTENAASLSSVDKIADQAQSIKAQAALVAKTHMYAVTSLNTLWVIKLVAHNVFRRLKKNQINSKIRLLRTSVRCILNTNKCSTKVRWNLQL